MHDKSSYVNHILLVRISVGVEMTKYPDVLIKVETYPNRPKNMKNEDRKYPEMNNALSHRQ